MPANTPRGYTYRLYTDPPPANFPAAMQDFATDVDTDVQSLVNTTTTVLNAPSARVSASANQSIPANVPTFVTWAVEEYDNAAMANLGVNNDRITFTSTGIYLVHAEINHAPNGNATVGGRGGTLTQNLSSQTSSHTTPGIQNTAVEWSLTDLIQVNTIGDFIRVSLRQNSGAAVNIDVRSFSATKVSS